MQWLALLVTSILTLLHFSPAFLSSTMSQSISIPTKPGALPSESGCGTETSPSEAPGEHSPQLDSFFKSGANLEGRGTEAAPSSGGRESAGTSCRSQRPKLTVSIPMRLISECAGRKVCVGTTDGSVYKGKLAAYDEVSTVGIWIPGLVHCSNC